MNVRLLSQPTSVPRMLSWGAQICGGILFIGWLGLVGTELFKNRFEMPDVEAFYQAAALATVFTGYWLSLRYVLAGSLLAIAGTVAFFVIAFVTVGFWPPLAALWLALPAALTLGAWTYSRRRRLMHRRHSFT